MESNLTTQLRDRIVIAMHVGRVHAGDRLPSIREVARETGVHARAVAKAYRVLEREGLVEVRGRSGVYAAPQERWGDKLLAETARWIAGVLVEGWKRDIPMQDLPELIRKCIRSVRLNAVCVEGSEDHRVALCTELRADFGLKSTSVPVEDLPQPTRGKPADPSVFPAALRAADLMVTTAFHAGTVRPAAEALRKPLVVVTLRAEIAQAIEGQLEKAGLTLVCTDPAFGEQLRSVYPGRAHHIRVVLADDADALAELPPTEPVLLTRAARAQLGEIGLPMLLPHASSLAPESARELAELMIRLNMEAKRT